MKCSECKFFSKTTMPEFGEDGECRFNPPHLMNSDDPVGYFPCVYPGWWCGKFEVKEKV